MLLIGLDFVGLKTAKKSLNIYEKLYELSGFFSTKNSLQNPLKIETFADTKTRHTQKQLLA